MSAPTSVVSAASVDRIAMSLRAATLEQLHRALPPDRADPEGPPAVTASDSVRVGMDLVAVSDVAASVDRLGRRYLYRVFTPHERACARIEEGGPGSYSMQSLASRFAAKEAAVKVLRPQGPRPEWRSIEVHRAAGGWCELRLSGLAATLATEAGISALAVSVTHEPAMAAACVVAMGGGEATAWPGTSHPHLSRPPSRKERGHG